MDNIFIVRVVLSFLIAGGWIAFSTIIAEKLGSKVGGLIANLPSNILISLVFIAIVNDVDYITEAVPGIPIGLMIDTIFLVVFIIILRYNLIIAIIVSLFVWFGLAFGMAKFQFENLFINIILYFILTILSVLLMEKRFHIPSLKNHKKKYSIIQVLYRAIFAGSIVSSIVVISKFCNPYFTGIFSTFPAMLLSTLIILTINQSRDFAMATGKVLLLSTTNIIVYALAVYYTYPTLGVLLGTIVSYLISTFWIWLLHPIVKKMS